MALHDVACFVCQALWRGVTRSKRRALQWCRKAAENSHADECLELAWHMYMDLPYAREVGHVEEAAGVATSSGLMEGRDVPLDVLTGVVNWLHKGGHPDVMSYSTNFAEKRWRAIRIASTKGARLWDI